MGLLAVTSRYFSFSSVKINRKPKTNKTNGFKSVYQYCGRSAHGIEWRKRRRNRGREREREKERKKKEIEIRKSKKSEECNHAQGCSRIFDDGPLTVLSQEKNGDKREKDYFYTVKPGLCASAVKRLVNSPNE